VKPVRLRSAVMHYREYAPSPAVQSFVHCLWTLAGHATELQGQAQPVVPDGRSEIILHFGDPFDRLYADGSVERQASFLFAGQLMENLVLRPTGRIALVGIRLHPDGATALIAAPQRHFVGLTVGMDDVSAGLLRSLTEVRERATSLPAAVRLIQDRVSRHADRSRLDPRISHVAKIIQRSHGRVSVERLARDAGVTRRHLERQFLDRVGVSPKRLARIVRLQHALQMLERVDTEAKGAITAAACGYADQAHFIRECQDVCGHPPGAHLLQRGELTGFFMG
jgi:AraC-like DNA-binding protein